jgi:hypothetical protein
VDENGSKVRPAFVGLAHELGHAVATVEGKQSSDFGTQEPGTTPPAEKQSMEAENGVRKDHELPAGGIIMNNHLNRNKLTLLFFCVIALILIASFWSNPSAGQVDPADELQTNIAELEKRLSLPLGAYELASYDRIYAKHSEANGPVIVGILRHRVDRQGTVMVVNFKSLPVVFDGGCNVVRIRYSLIHRRFDLVKCNGES